jgi:iron(III) transport system ATP-binding protein
VLQVENLTKLYAAKDSGGIRDIGFEVAAGEFYTLLGPSGCGKTTTLRSVAGLEEPSGGRVTLEDRVIFDFAKGIFVPANERRLGMVFQSYAVWPHMSVYDNTAFPLRMARDKRWSKADIRPRVTRTLETMGLAALAGRSAAQLSGGQQQRLALARALVGEPRLLLLDEPLSNLDALLREQMRSELRRLQKEVGVTAVYVTHDQSEALALSDRIAIMHNGTIVQIGAPRQIYDQPRNAFVATFIGRSNLLPGKLLDGDQQSVRIATALGPVLCKAPNSAAGRAPGAALIRPEHVILKKPGDHAGAASVNRFRGRVVQLAFLGEATECVVRVGDISILARGLAGQYDTAEEVDVFFPPEQTSAIVDDEASSEAMGNKHW